LRKEGERTPNKEHRLTNEELKKMFTQRCKGARKKEERKEFFTFGERRVITLTIPFDLNYYFQLLLIIKRSEKKLS
jgi:hypothetical protein